MAESPERTGGHEETARPRRIVVLGTSGSGKSTLATRLARELGIDHVELDALHHGPHWTPRPTEEFAADIAELRDRPAWVVDGNYIDRVADTLWPRADLVVWLDLPLAVILPRILRRTVRRIRHRTELWAGNREDWSALFGRHSLLVWAVRSQRAHQAELPGRLAALRRSGVRVVRLTSGRAADRWLVEEANG
ncbi:AAA family ATPase [Actinoalloteichus caeruleus]|uniref:AAA family ATPase n=1 Tax=Actinoalloteichus cyanogriseus TaxID=2893586 RepID=UPI00068DBBA3|nr:AAA family ATPase [Actinoalloteichus caeruleus]